MAEGWRRLLAWLRPWRSAGTDQSALRQHDYRLDELERDLSETEARLRVLEYEADLRGELRRE